MERDQRPRTKRATKDTVQRLRDSSERLDQVLGGLNQSPTSQDSQPEIPNVGDFKFSDEYIGFLADAFSEATDQLQNADPQELEEKRKRVNELRKQRGLPEA